MNRIFGGRLRRALERVPAKRDQHRETMDEIIDKGIWGFAWEVIKLRQQLAGAQARIRLLEEGAR